MNLKYEWINTLFIILPLSLCVFIIVDIAYNERIWELDTFAVKARLQALGITVAYFYLLNYIFKRVARFFIDKSKDEKKANWKEYVWVFLINFVLLNIMHTFINDGRDFQMGRIGIDQCDRSSPGVSILYNDTQ